MENKPVEEDNIYEDDETYENTLKAFEESRNRERDKKTFQTVSTKKKNFTEFPDLKRFIMNVQVYSFLSIKKPAKAIFRTINKAIELSLDGQTISLNDITSITTYNMQTPKITFQTSKSTFNVGFNNLMDKYIFESILYNNALMTISREFGNNTIKIKVCTMTWNVSESKMMDLSTVLNEWFGSADIIALGLQECKVIQMNQWIKSIETLCEHYDYSLIERNSLYQMLILVFIRKDLKRLVSNIETQTKGMGFANYFGNKGALYISFKLMGYTFVFVNSHLCAKVFKQLERNKMAKSFVNKVKLENEKIAPMDIIADYIFWFGDLNYRVDCFFSETIQKLNAGQLDDLLPKDQLNKLRKTNKIFTNFDEKKITFLPTYRRVKTKDSGSHNSISFNPSSNINEEQNFKMGRSMTTATKPIKLDNKNISNYGLIYSNKDEQSPSWCDRILISSENKYEILDYNSLEDIKFSDHIPVKALYSLTMTLPNIQTLQDNGTIQRKNSVRDQSGNMKEVDDNVAVRFSYTNLNLSYNISESEFTLKPPVNFRIEVYHPVLEDSPIYVANCENYENQNERGDWISVNFDDFEISLSPKVIFDFPQLKSFNVFFVIKMIHEKVESEIGYAKYSFEKAEESGNLFAHQMKLVVYHSLVRMGYLSFDARYDLQTLSK